MTTNQYTPYLSAQPYFDLVRVALDQLVDGAHFFDCVADDIVYEVRYEFPGWPRKLAGRSALMHQFLGYGNVIRLHSAGHLVKNVSGNGQVIVIEYQVNGTIVATGAPYENRFCSIIEIENRKIAHWRDYMDTLAAWHALTPGVR